MYLLCVNCILYKLLKNKTLSVFPNTQNMSGLQSVCNKCLLTNKWWYRGSLILYKDLCSVDLRIRQPNKSIQGRSIIWILYKVLTKNRLISTKEWSPWTLVKINTSWDYTAQSSVLWIRHMTIEQSEVEICFIWQFMKLCVQPVFFYFYILSWLVIVKTLKKYQIGLWL